MTGLAAVLFGLRHPECDYAEANVWWREKCEADATVVLAWLRDALQAPEVVKAGARAINDADNDALVRTNFDHICATYDEQATATLAAAVEALTDTTETP